MVGSTGKELYATAVTAIYLPHVGHTSRRIMMDIGDVGVARRDTCTAPRRSNAAR